MTDEKELKAALTYIDPSTLSYGDWMQVGMAIKAAGASCELWDEWSRKDPDRYDGGCYKKWESFQGSGITENTLFKMAIERGYSSEGNNEHTGREILDDEIIDPSDYHILDRDMIDSKEVPEPGTNWDPVADIRNYISAVFEPDDHVAYCTNCFKDDKGKYHPGKRTYDRTAGRLLEELDSAEKIEDVFYDYDHECGAWISFNPMDGQGGKINNITDYRYALVESDTNAIDMQYAIMTELQLPIVALVHSGNKSLHAIVRVDASNEKEYSRHVDYLYKICKQNGLDVDQSAKNPSRLSRMPGFWRGKKKQFLIATNIGQPSWDAWTEYIESVNDDLPDPENLAAEWNSMPDLAQPLIEGVLRQGHKMLLAGPSKAGKSFSLIELCIAIAEGRKWLSWQCAQGKILYVNLELDRASCLHRFKDVYEALNIPPKNLKNIEIWNLRGKSVPMDKLAPKLIRRASKENFIAVVIDPIYKVITGDENSAEQMAKFTNQFDKIATSLNCSVIYCHHHSKGAQGGKRSMDRASGSGVFARDPDAMIDMIELPLNDSVIDREKNEEVCRVLKNLMQKHDPHEYAEIPEDQLKSRRGVMTEARRILIRKNHVYDDNSFDDLVKDIEKKVETMTAWRIDMTLREFPKPKETNIWFSYPIHEVDQTGALDDLDPEEDMPLWKKGKMAQKTPEERQNKRQNEFEIAYENLSQEHEQVTVKMMYEYMNVSERTIWNRLKQLAGRFKTVKGEGKSSPTYIVKIDGVQEVQKS